MNKEKTMYRRVFARQVAVELPANDLAMATGGDGPVMTEATTCENLALARKPLTARELTGQVWP